MVNQCDKSCPKCTTGQCITQFCHFCISKMEMSFDVVFYASIILMQLWIAIFFQKRGRLTFSTFRPFSLDMHSTKSRDGYLSSWQLWMIRRMCLLWSRRMVSNLVIVIL
jgi:hypothetical protein